MSTLTRETLAQARLYLCTDARERQGDLAAFLDQKDQKFVSR